MSISPDKYLKEVMLALTERKNTVAVAIWLRNAQGYLQLQCESNINGVGIDNYKNGRKSHNELLRQAFQTPKPLFLEPLGRTGVLEGIPAGNPTDYIVYIAPLISSKLFPFGLLEVWQGQTNEPKQKRIFLNQLVQIATRVSEWFRGRDEPK